MSERTSGRCRPRHRSTRRSRGDGAPDEPARPDPPDEARRGRALHLRRHHRARVRPRRSACRPRSRRPSPPAGRPEQILVDAGDLTVRAARTRDRRALRARLRRPDHLQDRPGGGEPRDRAGRQALQRRPDRLRRVRQAPARRDGRPVERPRARRPQADDRPSDHPVVAAPDDLAAVIARMSRLDDAVAEAIDDSRRRTSSPASPRSASPRTTRRSSSSSTRSSPRRSRRARPTSTSSRWSRATCACATASTACSGDDADPEADDRRRRLAREDHGRPRHRRAPAAAGRPRVAAGRGPRRSTFAS